MIRLFLILMLVLLPTVSKAEYKWFDARTGGGLYIDLYNSIINDSKIQFYMLFNQKSSVPDRESNSWITITEVDCSELSMIFKSFIYYSESNGKGEVVETVNNSIENIERSKNYLQPNSPLHEDFKFFCSVVKDDGPEYLQAFGEQLSELQPLE